LRESAAAGSHLEFIRFIESADDVSLSTDLSLEQCQPRRGRGVNETTSTNARNWDFVPLPQTSACLSNNDDDSEMPGNALLSIVIAPRRRRRSHSRTVAVKQSRFHESSANRSGYYSGECIGRNSASSTLLSCSDRGENAIALPAKRRVACPARRAHFSGSDSSPDAFVVTYF